MAKFTTSPGVAINEIDQTFLTGQPIQAGAAIIGPTVKGPVEQPTLVTSYSDFTSKFGDTFVSGGSTHTYLTSIAAFNYFNYGGESLIVARVTSGSYTSATASISGSDGSGSFTLETISEGTPINNRGGLAQTNELLLSGSRDNVRWEVTNSNTTLGTFSLLIRQGNDVGNNKIILEQFNNLSLDPNQPNYISKVIGDQKLSYESTTNQMEITGNYVNSSRYVRIKEVHTPIFNYLDANGLPKDGGVFTGSLPGNGTGLHTGSFTGALGNVSSSINLYQHIGIETQGLVGTDYDNMISLLGNREAYSYNLLFTPGLTNDLHAAQCTSIITNTINRGDSLFVLDLEDYSGTQANAITQAQSRNTSYVASYWPWVRIVDPGTGKHVWVPASTMIPGVYAFNDKVAAPWFAPAGINRGGLSTVLQAKIKLTQGNRDDLYNNNINPIATFPNQGVVVFGQKTLQKENSALDRVNVRRLMIELKNFIRQIADTIVFEQNTQQTRVSFKSRVNPYLESIQLKQGLFAYKIIMDETNNGPAVIDQNQLVGQIYIQPTRTSEFISLDFILQPTGAEFPS